MATAAFNCSIFITGASTAFTTEAFTGATTTWQITAAAKRIWNSGTIPSFFDNAVAIPSNQILSIDYLFGRVVFTGAKTGPITATGAYFPSLTIAEGHAFSLTASRDVLETTIFGDLAHRRIETLLDASGEINIYDVISTDLDPGGGSRVIKDCIDNETPVVITMSLNAANTCLYRALAIITDADLSSSIGGLVEGTVNWLASSLMDAAGRPVHFNYVDA